MKTTDRKFEVWDWTDRSVTLTPLQFEVRIERPVNVAEGKIRYYIKHDDPKISVEATDLGALRDKLDAAVRAFYAIEWSPVLVVRVAKAPSHRRSDRDGVSFELKFEIVDYERGMLHGQPVHRRLLTNQPVGMHERSYDYAITNGDLDREFREFRADAPRKQWVIPDTADSRALLIRLNANANDLLASITAMLDALPQAPVLPIP